jgi:hypothetical protein
MQPVATETWYVDSSRNPVNWNSAVQGGIAQTAIYRVVSDDSVPWPLEYLWAAQGTAVTSGQVTEAQAGQSSNAVPDGYTAPNLGESYDRVLVLDSDDPIPPGVPADTVIVRKS